MVYIQLLFNLLQVRHTLIGRSVLWKQKHIKDCSQLAKKQGSLQKYSALRGDKICPVENQRKEGQSLHV